MISSGGVSSIRLLTTVVASLAATFALGGCAADARPPASQNDDATSTFEFAADKETVAPAKVCEPGATRACRAKYIDEQGQLQCPLSYRRCRADGFWGRCGEDVDPNAPPPAESDLDAAEADADASVPDPAN